MNLEEMTKKELIAEVEKAEAEIAEAEKEIYARSEGEEKEWERAEKAEAELVEYKTINPKEYDWVAENQRLQERVRELEGLIQYVLDCDMAEQEFDAQRLMDAIAQIQTEPEAICHCGHPLHEKHRLPNDSKQYQCPECRRVLKAQAQTKEGE